jgi:hypothetical protein
MPIIFNLKSIPPFVTEEHLSLENKEETGTVLHIATELTVRRR